MGWGLICALLAAVAYGTASIMQAIAARAVEDSAYGVDPRLLVRVLKQWKYLAGLGLDLVGFAAQLLALRVLPLFLVQAALAGSLAVTAIAATFVGGSLGVRLTWREWASVAMVCLGLALLGVSAAGEGSEPVAWGFHLALPLSALMLGGMGMLAGRASAQIRTPALGLVAGLCFGVVAISGRVIDASGLIAVVSDPATYAIAIAGALAMLFYASALQRGGVTTATAAMVIGETVLPSAIGVLVLGDTTRPGFAALAIIGFLLAVFAAISLSRFGEPG